MVAQQSVWLWRSEDDLWELFDASDTEKIATAQQLGDQGMILQRHSKTYFIDFQRVTQTNVETGCQRRICEVKPGSEWLRNTSHNRETDWQKIPKRDAADMERALFARQDSVILDRETDVYYVDFAKWTMVSLNSGVTYKINIKSEGPRRQDSCPSTANKSVGSSNSVNPGSGGQTEPQHRCTPKTALPEPTEEEEIIPFGAPVNEPAKRKRFMNPQESGAAAQQVQQRIGSRSPNYVWHWRNDYGSWDLYDKETIHKIEEALNGGEDSMMFMREHSPYFLDLVNFTQTNVSTGCTREIRRIQCTVHQ